MEDYLLHYYYLSNLHTVSFGFEFCIFHTDSAFLFICLLFNKHYFIYLIEKRLICIWLSKLNLNFLALIYSSIKQIGIISVWYKGLAIYFDCLINENRYQKHNLFNIKTLLILLNGDVKMKYNKIHCLANNV